MKKTSGNLRWFFFLQIEQGRVFEAMSSLRRVVRRHGIYGFKSLTISTPWEGMLETTFFAVDLAIVLCCQRS